MAKATQGNSTALIPHKGTAVATLESLADKARGFAEQAHSEATRRRYRQCWDKFTGWCDLHGLQAMPAAPGTLAGFVTWLAEGQPGAGKRGTRYQEGHALANSSIQQALAAIKFYHRLAGHPLSEIMREAANHPDSGESKKWAAFQQVLDGVRRSIGQSRPIRRVKPIDAATLRDMLEMLRPNVLREARDAAILAVGFGGCRRRSEVIGLDYMERSKTDPGRGVLTIEDKGIVIRLFSSKTNQDGSGEETYVIPRQHARLLCDVTQNWIEVGAIKRGEPVFRGLPASGNSKSAQSGYRGVYSYRHRSGKVQWVATAPGQDGKRRHLGYYDDARSAHLARCRELGEKPQAPFDPGRLLSAKRLDLDQVAVLIKRRYADLLRSQMGRKKLRPEDIQSIAAKVAELSSHSMRVGHITSASEIGTPTHLIQLASGHKSPAMISLYTRVSDKINKSSLKGMGF